MMKILTLNKKDILDYQQNRDPYLMIDYATEVVPGLSSKGFKDFKKDEWFFKVHWKNDPNMPAMLQLETMSQTASLCLFSKSKPPEKLYLTRIESASFRKKIIPEMTIEISSTQLKRVKNVYTYKCVIRDFHKRNLISKSYLDLLWPTM